MVLVFEKNIVTKVKINGTDIEDYLVKNTPSIEISYSITFPYQYSIKILEDYVKFYFECLIGISKLQKADPCLSANIASKIFELMTPFWQSLLSEGKHLHAICFWKNILKITLAWEKKNNKHIHKGSLHGYIAWTYLAMGDSYSGFSYLNSALAEDVILNNVCPTFNYPKDAPCNKTLSLNTAVNNFMQPFVLNVKAFLHSFMNEFKHIDSNFNINDFDNWLLENDSLLLIKIFFVYNMWLMFDNINKYEFVNGNNLFNKQINLNSLLNLSFVLDNILNYYQTLNNEQFKNNKNIMFGSRIHQFIKKSKLNEGYYKSVISKYKYADLDESLKILLKKENNKEKTKVNYLLISLFLRNFVAHKIQNQDISLSPYYQLIIKAQLYSIYNVLSHYNAKH